MFLTFNREFLRLFRRDVVKIDYCKAIIWVLCHVMRLKGFVETETLIDPMGVGGSWIEETVFVVVECLIINQLNLVGLLSGETLRRGFIQFSLG